MSRNCEKCGRYIYKHNENCRCKAFKVYYPEYFGEEKEIKYGNSFEDIAEKLAMKINEDDYTVNDYIFESPIEIEDIEGEIKLFNVYAEPEINYYPKEIIGEKNERKN